MTLLLVACSDDQAETVENYLGIWEAPFNCTGPLHEMNLEMLVITIYRGETDNTVKVDFGDDVIFDAVIDGSDFTLEPQVLNEGFGYDEVSMAAEGTLMDDNTLSLSLTHSVDNEGISTCELNLTK